MAQRKTAPARPAVHGSVRQEIDAKLKQIEVLIKKDTKKLARVVESWITESAQKKKKAA